MPGTPELNLADVDRLFDGFMQRTALAEPDKKLMTSKEVNERIADHIDRKMSKIINTVVMGAIAVAGSVGVGAWTLSVQIRDAVHSATESDARLNARAQWMQRQEYHNREQDRVLLKLDPTYQPPAYRDIPQ